MATPRCAGGSVDFNHDRFLNWTSTGSVPKPNRTFVIVLLCHRKVGSDVFCSVVTLTSILRLTAQFPPCVYGTDIKPHFASNP